MRWEENCQSCSVTGNHNSLTRRQTGMKVDDERLIEDVRRVKQEIQRLMKIGYYRTLMNYWLILKWNFPPN